MTPDDQVDDAAGAEQVRRALADALLRDADALLNYVIPIHAVQNASPVQAGTGTLFRVAEERFLVTAHHVAEIQTTHQIPLCVSDGKPRSPFVPLQCRILVAPGLFDVAAFHLARPIWEALERRRFLTLHDVDLLPRPHPNELFLVCGYPTHWASTERDGERTLASNKMLVYGAGRYAGPTSFEDYDPGHHLLLDLSMDENVVITGPVKSLPSELGGISGCSVMRGVPGEGDGVFAVVAIETGLYLRRVIKATWWGAVVAMLHKLHSELRGPLRLHPQWEESKRLL